MGAFVAGDDAQQHLHVAKLRAHLATVRAEGVAYDECESNDSVRCVAAPVRDHTGRIVAAMSISVPALLWTEERAPRGRT